MSDKKGLFYHPETGEVLNGIRQSLLSLDGRFEYPDPIPHSPVVPGRDPARGMRELVQAMIRQEFSELAASREMETFEEADDFGIEDDPVEPFTDAELMALEGEARVREKAAAAASQPPGGAVSSTNASAPPSSAKLVDEAVKPPQPIVKRSESSEGVAAPTPEGSVDRT